MCFSHVSVLKHDEFHSMIYQKLLVLKKMKLEKAVRTSTGGFSLLVLVMSLVCGTNTSSATDIITARDSIKDGETIISSGGNFELGFFSPGNSNYRYVGIWYKKISLRTVVWVANRETPLTNTTGVLRVLNPGILVLSNDTNTVIWSTNTSRPVQNPIAQLLDSGNLVVRDSKDDNPDNFFWQSFHYPTDTLLPDMQLGKNFETGREVNLSSWKSKDDPAPGDFIYQCDPTGYPQNVLRKGHVVQYRAGPWNGLRFSGAQNSRKNSIYSFGLVSNDKEVYFYYHLISSVISRYVLNQSGVAQRWTWVDRTQEWILYLTSPNDNCDSYALCGPYGTCRIGNSPVCGCLDKFVPKYPSNWVMGDWSSGCTRSKPLDCPSGDGFLKYSGIKLPDTRNSWYNRNMTLEGCKSMCLKNCSCMAYANADVRNGGSGCLLWFDDLIDIRGITEGQDIYIRVASSELGMDFAKEYLGQKEFYKFCY